MSKKRNRQPDANPNASDGSSESYDEPSDNCPHTSNAVNLSKIKKKIKKIGVNLECAGCKNKGSASSTPETEEKESKVPPSIWICLQCGHQGCGRERNAHAVEHFKKIFSDCHAVVANTLHWTVWCYHCEIEINPSSKKKLLETVMFVKKLVSTPLPAINASSSQSLKSKNPQVVQNGINGTQCNSHTPVHARPKGLANLGNTCFFNAVLQCLAQTPYLAKVLDDLRLPGQKFVLPGGKHKPPNSSEEVDLPPIEGTLEGWGNFSSILYKTLVEMQSSDGYQTITPLELLTAFKKKIMHCMDGAQHDSHELLRHLLEIVRTEDLRRYQSVILKEVGLNEKTNPEGVEHSLKSRAKFYGNQASARLLGAELIFRGVLVSTLECLDCHHTSISTESFLDLSLPVVADKPVPPYFKRKNTPLEETYDTLLADFMSETSKTQRRIVRRAPLQPETIEENERLELWANSNLTHGDNATREINGTASKADESDADVEDNDKLERLLSAISEIMCSTDETAPVASPATNTTAQISSNTTTSVVCKPYVYPRSFRKVTEPESVESDIPTTANSSELFPASYFSNRKPIANRSLASPAEEESPSSISSYSPPAPTSPAARINVTSNTGHNSNSHDTPVVDTCGIDTYACAEERSEGNDVPDCETGNRSIVASRRPYLDNTAKTFNIRVSVGCESDATESLLPALSIPLPASPWCGRCPSVHTPNDKDNAANEKPDEDKKADAGKENDEEKEEEEEEDSFEEKLRKEELETEKAIEVKNQEDAELDDKSKEIKESNETMEIPIDERNGKRKIDSPVQERAANVHNSTVSAAQNDIAVHELPTRYPTKEGECSIKSCLNRFTAIELMSGSNKVGCESCTAREQKEKENCKMVFTSTTRQYLISQVPAVLVLHLKRSQAQRFDYRKVSKHVPFPMLLDLAPVCKNHRKSRIYSLYGIVEHSGTMYGGHYVAYVKTRAPLASNDRRWSFLPPRDAKETDDSSNSSESLSDSEGDQATANTATTIEPPHGKWYHISDSRVSEVDEKTVLQSQAYLLFYERIL